MLSLLPIYCSIYLGKGIEKKTISIDDLVNVC